MIKMQLFAFILRWLASSIGMFFCITYLGTVNPEATIAGENAWLLFAVAGLIFSLVNSIVKPVIKIFALPLAILTMGLSTIVINTIMVLITIHLLPGVDMGFFSAMLSSIILSIINYVLNLLIS